jgi:hypothetical protein
MRGHIERRVIYRVLVPAGGFGALRVEDVVDLFFDVCKLCFGRGLADPASQGIERIQRTLSGCGLAQPKEFPGRSD